MEEVLARQETDRMTYEHRIASDDIDITYMPNHIFVFGSNLSGRHGKGAAKRALTWGAKWGQAAGLQGRTYGIPTKDFSVRKTLPLPKIQVYVTEFIEFAKTRPDLTFLVTEIGCGLAGLDPKEVAPLFKDAVSVENIHLPARFWRKIAA